MSDNRTWTVPDFGPNDLLTSDKIGERAVKVSLDNLSDVEGLLVSSLFGISDTLLEINRQMRLLNTRIEEAFETKIKESDIDEHTGY